MGMMEWNGVRNGESVWWEGVLDRGWRRTGEVVCRGALSDNQTDTEWESGSRGVEAVGVRQTEDDERLVQRSRRKFSEEQDADGRERDESSG
jgi:hypothetical protein